MSAAQRALEETNELLDQMQMEKQNVPSAQRAAINRRLRDYKTDVDGYRRKLQTAAEDKNALFGGRYTDNPSSSSGDAHFEQRQQLLAGMFWDLPAIPPISSHVRGLTLLFQAPTGWIAARSGSRPAKHWLTRPRPSAQTPLRSSSSSARPSTTPPGPCTRARAMSTAASRASRGSLVGMTF